MDIIISNGSNEPIYEQITRQIKAAIMAGDVNEGDPLPSIRALANDLRISVITTKRAYAELEEAGFIDTVQGKGSFVAGGNLELLREERLRQVEGHLARAVAEAENAGIEAADLHAMLMCCWKKTERGADMTYLMEIDNLGKHYDDFELSGVSLAVEPDCVVGFIGSNGAGKTTTIKAALGIIAADEGAVRLFGQPIACGSPELDTIKSRIGVVLDTCAFPDTCRVGDVGAIGRAAYREWDAVQFAALCDRFNLAPKKKVGELSRGMGMKLTLAFALSHNPELLVLDEATAGLDPIARDEVLDLLRDFMAEGDRGILMSTHITSDLEKIADEVVCVDAGRIVFAAPKDAITDEAGVARCRAADVTAVLDAGFFAPGDARILRHDYGCDVLAPDRFAFARAFPDIPVDKATIEDYMTLILKGESR